MTILFVAVEINESDRHPDRDSFSSQFPAQGQPPSRWPTQCLSRGRGEPVMKSMDTYVSTFTSNVSTAARGGVVIPESLQAISFLNGLPDEGRTRERPLHDGPNRLHPVVRQLRFVHLKQTKVAPPVAGAIKRDRVHPRSRQLEENESPGDGKEG